VTQENSGQFSGVTGSRHGMWATIMLSCGKRIFSNSCTWLFDHVADNRIFI
jgi:hypothetical protein